MPQGLSHRGRLLYAAMNPTSDDPRPRTDNIDENTTSAKTLRRVLTFAVVTVLVVMSSLHFTEISNWVSDHAPSFGDSPGGHQKGDNNAPTPVKGKGDKAGTGDKSPTTTGGAASNH
jgi:hypothetical protein